MQTLKTALCVALVSVVFSGCALFSKQDETTMQIHEQVSSALPAENALTVVIPRTDLKLTVAPYASLSQKDVLSAELYNTAGGEAILLRFDGHGSIVLDEMTTRNRGQYLVTFINKRPVAAWLVNQRILNGQLLVEGDFTDDEAKQVVDSLNKLSKANRR